MNLRSVLRVCVSEATLKWIRKSYQCVRSRCTTPKGLHSLLSFRVGKQRSNRTDPTQNTASRPIPFLNTTKEPVSKLAHSVFLPLFGLGIL